MILEFAFNASSESFQSRLFIIGKLNEIRQELKSQIAKGDLPSADIDSRRKALSVEIGRWRKIQIRIIPEIEGRLANMDASVEVEVETLYLPSDIDLADYEVYRLGDLGAVEIRLREGEANDAVINICNTVMHSMLLLDSKKRHAQGVYQNLRSLKHINNAKGKRDIAATQYRHARQCLLRLTGAKSLPNFPELKPEDMQAKNAAASRNLGDGSNTDSWIWNYGKLKAMNGEEREGFIYESESFYIPSFHIN